MRGSESAYRRRKADGVYRIREVLARLSRDRVLHPQTYRSVLWALCLKHSSNPWMTVKAAGERYADCAGLLRGRPAALPWERGYPRLIEEIEKIKPGDHAKLELAILKHIVRSAK